MFYHGSRRCRLAILAGLFFLLVPVRLLAAEGSSPKWVYATAHAIPKETTNQGSGYFSIVTGKNGRALYFSRSTIPFNRDQSLGVQYFKHLGFYAYRKAALDRFCNLPEAFLEAAERLEQLRFLENGTDIYVEETPYDTVGVDTEEDLRRVEEMLRSRG